MSRQWITLCVTLTIACVCAVGCASSVTLDLNRAELQQRLDDRFPVTKKRTLFELALSNPRLTLVERDDLLELTFSAEILALNSPVGEGEVTLQGGIRYDKDKKAFFLKDPQVTRLDVEKTPERHRDKMRKAVDVVVQEIVPSIPVYTLNKDTFKHSLSRTFLKRAWVADHALHLEMGI